MKRFVLLSLCFLFVCEFSAEIVISDLNGRILKQEQLNDQKINTSELMPGMYFLQIRRNEELVYKTKIVKE